MSTMKTILLSLLASIICFHSLFSQELTSGLLERSQIPEKYKWNTSDVYPDRGAWEADYLQIDSQLSSYKSYSGRLDESPELLLKCLQFDELIRVKLGYLRLYAKLNRDVEMQNELAQEMWSRYNARDIVPRYAW